MGQLLRYSCWCIYPERMSKCIYLGGFRPYYRPGYLQRARRRKRFDPERSLTAEVRSHGTRHYKPRPCNNLAAAKASSLDTTAASTAIQKP